MQYKTIILELIRQNEPLHDRLRSNRNLLATVDRLAAQLKADHETYLNQMVTQEPAASRSAVSQQAFEMAIKEAEEQLMAMTPAEVTVPGAVSTSVASGSKTSPGE
jgi:predicted DNA-binding protein (UPF0251 family)